MPERLIGPPRIIAWIALLCLGAAVGGWVHQAARGTDRSGQPTSLFDDRLVELSRASATWEFRAGPARRVADVVCLVPDLATFLEAVATWDEHHFFPILLDDAEYTLKFLRAFRPAQIVRLPQRAEPIPEDRLWEAAVAAVGRAWVADRPGTEPPRGDAVPRLSAPTPPGVVLSAPSSPSLAGAVALAAGRFQPLLRLDVAKGYGEVLTMDEAARLVADVERTVAAVVPEYATLGDACDFLTLAGPWPYRYELQIPDLADIYKDRLDIDIGGRAVVDDLIGRRSDLMRWAYTGRLVGDERASLYRAMCALFLQPGEAVLFDAYDPSNAAFADYDMTQADRRLAQAGLAVRRVAGPGQANVAGWHRAFDPVNRSRLVLINSSGGPTDFNLSGQKGYTDDVPPTDPAAVLMIHSFSAADPLDPATVAGRWLANGAFLYYGSVREPYLAAFRTPTLVADLIAQYLPFAAAVRQVPGEPFGIPWRLIYLGDPLYRLLPPERRLGRVAWEAVADWPSYRVPEVPAGADVTEAAKLEWALQKAIVDAARGPAAASDESLSRAVLAIRRDGLPAGLRPLLDALRVDVLMAHADRRPLRQAFAGIPAEEVAPAIRRLLVTSLVADLQRALDAGQTPTAGALWAELMRSDAPAELKRRAMSRTARVFEDRGRLPDWLRRLRLALRDDPTSKPLRDEIDRVRQKAEQRPATPVGGRGR